MILFNNTTNKPVKKGDILPSFRGEEYEITGWREPQHAGSTGRIFVKNGEYFPGVFNCAFRQEEE